MSKMKIYCFRMGDRWQRLRCKKNLWNIFISTWNHVWNEIKMF